MISGIYDITKEAAVLRTRLQMGSINIHELERFLGKVEAISLNHQNKKSDTTNMRFLAQLENLERGRARKPK